MSRLIAMAAEMLTRITAPAVVVRLRDELNPTPGSMKSDLCPDQEA
ncbi:hypothetical protein [Kibdelosporangium philippinense]